MLFGVSDPPRRGQRLRALSTPYKGGKDRKPSLISLASGSFLTPINT